MNILSTTLRPTAQKERPFSKYDNIPGHSKALMEMYMGINAVFIPANITAILQPIDQSHFDF